ncbi:M48 family metallopeptidase [Teredinibacter sp. KSP-S5-2]|uniref:M48 family metallopeptidase n=1 Tax=Teredinibacter sp. KSP-S5-2 TaxID=3034506 RepID=UPI002934B03D|nr:M48 family metallopeptidase [Teredinibacter sp. KSP-S5-2]WNO08104.1 M48 family metallopeptidase [Teredinibacter sp. KSP-S5-2]
MRYSNPEIPEGINVTQVHPLKEFFTLIAGVAGLVIVAVFLLAVTVQYLVTLIPFEKESQWLGRMGESFTASMQSEEISDNHQQIEGYLQQLADSLSEHQALPEGMTITVHYSEGDTVNAFATLGGNIVIFKGLLETLPHENALAMVMAHEIAHIKHRHPIVALGRGVAVGLVLVSLSGVGDGVAVQQLLGNLSMLTTLTFSRSQEELSDHDALGVLSAEYGHIGGAEALFEVLQKEYDGKEPPQILSTHPHTEKRIERIKEMQTAMDTDTEFKPLPDFILELKKANKKDSPDNT